MKLPRRDALKWMAVGGSCWALAALGQAADDIKRWLGIGNSSYWQLFRQDGSAVRDPLAFVRFCAERGAAGVQLSIGARPAAYAEELRREVQERGMYLEGSLQTPQDKADLERFDAELQSARRAGAKVVRTVMLSGRRYEVFDSAEAFEQFSETARRRLELAEPVLARHKLRLAVENHKDFRADQLVDLMRHLSSEHIGVCVDTGNNLALLEDVLETTRSLAPWAAACHLKDMAVELCEEGFLLAEVPLGEGIVDLAGVVSVLRQSNPEIQFSLEMITRDPLLIPCLTDRYWATLPDVPGRDLARTLALVRQHSRPLPRLSTLDSDEQLAAEDENVRRSLAYAHHQLGHAS